MNPAIISLIAAAIGEALRMATQAVSMLRLAQSGVEVTPEQIDEIWKKSQSDYAAARAAWDAAGNPAPPTAPGPT